MARVCVGSRVVCASVKSASGRSFPEEEAVGDGETEEAGGTAR